MAKILFTSDIEGVPADVTSVSLSDPTGTYGLKREDTDAVVVAAGVSLSKTETGHYEYVLPSLAEGIWHTYWIAWTFGGETHHLEYHFVSVRTSAVDDTLSHTPAEIVRAYLLAEGLGTLYTLNQDWAIYVSFEPESDNVPNNLIVVYDTAPVKDARLGTGQVVQHYGILINVRALERSDAWAKAQSIQASLAGVLRQDVDCEGFGYRIPCVAVGQVIDLGLEPQTQGRKRRSYFSLNVLIPIEHIG